MMKRHLALAAALLMAIAFAPVARGERRTVTRTYNLSHHEDIDADIRVGEATIESLRIHGWPKHDDIEKGRRDHGDSHSIDVVFTYSNHDHENDYKCKYTVELLTGEGRVLGEGDADRSLDKKKRHDTNKVSLRMHTHRYGQARKIRVTYHVREKD